MSRDYGSKDVPCFLFSNRLSKKKNTHFLVYIVRSVEIKLYKKKAR